MNYKNVALLFALVLALTACDTSELANDPGPTATSAVHVITIPLGNQLIGVMRANWYEAHPGCVILQDMIKNGELVISYECDTEREGP